MPSDQSQRIAALDPARSFIVQAPAGSGKTGLLTQRYLGLLATVENPEEVVAITFTRKAAAEMRARILQALAGACEAEPAGAWEQLTWQLARSALRQAERLDWKLLDNPQRLRIRTIDSLCQFIARQMPLRSGFGDVPGIEENPADLYRAAARSVLKELESDTELAAALDALLEPLDNRLDALLGLIADMLARRDQWLPVVLRPNQRQEIERSLRLVVEAHLRRLAGALPSAVGRELAGLAHYAAEQLGSDHPVGACHGLEGLPPPTLEGLPAWRGLVELLLTQKGEWRKKVDKRNGFPTGKGLPKQAKERMMTLLDSLGEDAELASILHGLRALPDPGYTDADWSLLQALFTVLTESAAHLELVMRDHGKTDFIGTALAAQAALGEDLDPSDLALRIDYGLRHLLVDEFQDTSQIQHELLRRLTAGWQPADGRTLFLVGDPMQSIYRFRKAEVGLFLDAWQGRLGQVPLEPLQLEVNFRSELGLIDWVNRQFPLVFPAAENKVTGAVPYVPSVAFEGPAKGALASVHPFVGRDDAAEAQLVVDLIRSAEQAMRGGTIAVLVRSKAHLEHLTGLLRSENMPFQAVEIGALADRPAVQDLLSLALALLHRADRVSWLAVLRGPLCGMTLADLHVLTGADCGVDWMPVPDLLADEAIRRRLSGDGQLRAEAFWRNVAPVLDDCGRTPLRGWVEGLWLALGGPATLRDDASADDAEEFFRLLDGLEESGQALTPERLREAVEALYSTPDSQAGEQLQLMTVHKAKGLEFDTVILPGLGKRPRGDSRRLLYWLETTGEAGEPQLFFGPVKSMRSDDEPRTSAYIKALEQDIGRLEDARLLYVAATRARRRLHLIGHATPGADGSPKPDAASLLARLWPAVGHHWEGLHRASAAADGPQSPGEASASVPPAGVPDAWRLPTGWDCPPPPATAGILRRPAGEGSEAVVYEWAGDTARAVGTVVHRWLQRMAELWPVDPTGAAGFDETVRRMLLREGVPAAGLDAARGQVRRALERTLQDERGRWLLWDGHAESRCEAAITARIDGELRALVVDRTFVDADGVRWIIDYKTGTHEGGDVAGFLNREAERYRGQLARYAAAYRRLEDRPIIAALYYPLVPGGWREVDIDHGS